MIFFDIDDTLLDYKSSQDLAAAKFANKYKNRLFVHPDEFVRHWDSITKIYMDRYLSGKISFEEQRRERIKASIIDISNHEIDTFFGYYHALYKESWQLFPECIEALDVLKSKRLGIITNGDPVQQRNKLKHLKIDHYFEFLVTPNDVGVAKPNPKIFKYAAFLAKTPSFDCWYVGDDYNKDYLAAKNEHWQSIWLNRQASDKKPDYVCSNLLEFSIMAA